MGFFGGDNDNSSQDEANNLMEQQINENNADLEQKRQSLVQQRMDIIKSQGAENWTPDRTAGYGGSGGSGVTPPKAPSWP